MWSLLPKLKPKPVLSLMTDTSSMLHRLQKPLVVPPSWTYCLWGLFDASLSLYVLRRLQWPLTLPAAANLEACPVILSFCQRRCLPQPQIKNAKGAARKSGWPRLSGLMSKMFQSAGNLLQSSILSLFTSKTQRNEREEEWYLAVGSDRLLDYWHAIWERSRPVMALDTRWVCSIVLKAADKSSVSSSKTGLS